MLGGVGWPALNIVIPCMKQIIQRNVVESQDKCQLVPKSVLNQNIVVVVDQLLGIYMTVHTAWCQTQP